MAVSIAAAEYLDHDTGSFVSRRGRRETLEFKGLWAGDSPEIVLYRSPVSQCVLSLIFIIATAISIVVSVRFPDTVLHLPLTVRGREFELFAPILGIVPLGLFVVIAHRLLNYRYVLTPTTLVQVKGLVGLRLVWSELHYKDIREVVVYQDPTQEIFNLGDIQIGSDINEEEIVLRGIHNPLRLKLIIRERINAARTHESERQRRANDSW